MEVDYEVITMVLMVVCLFVFYKYWQKDELNDAISFVISKVETDEAESQLFLYKSLRTSVIFDKVRIRDRTAFLMEDSVIKAQVELSSLRELEKFEHHDCPISPLDINEF